MKTGSSSTTIAFMLSLGGIALYAQQVPPGTTPSAAPPSETKPIIEPRALEVLKLSRDTMLRLKTYQAECRTTITSESADHNQHYTWHALSTIMVSRPNRMLYNDWQTIDTLTDAAWIRPATGPKVTYACDGTHCWVQSGSGYQKDPAGYGQGPQLEPIPGVKPWSGFFEASNAPYAMVATWKEHELREARYLGSKSVSGVSCDEVLIDAVIKYPNIDKFESRETWYIGDDHIVRRRVGIDIYESKPSSTFDDLMVNIKLNVPIDQHSFVYTPPAGVTLMPVFKPGPLLSNGVLAPDFTALTSDNKTVKLSDYHGKVTVVDFWASWCGPCTASMPHNQEVMQRLQAESLPVALLAVDDGEERAAFDEWLKNNAAAYPALTFAHIPRAKNVSGKLFSVTGIPTQYVIDKSGVIRASFIGGGHDKELETAIRAALKSGG